MTWIHSQLNWKFSRCYSPPDPIEKQHIAPSLTVCGLEGEQGAGTVRVKCLSTRRQYYALAGRCANVAIAVDRANQTN